MQILYVDMDNVLVDFPSGIARVSTELQCEYDNRLDEVPGIFSLMQPMPRLLYAEGKGVIKDMAEAQRLMATAASLNDDEAKEWLDEHCPQKPDWLVKLRTGEDV